MRVSSTLQHFRIVRMTQRSYCMAHLHVKVYVINLPFHFCVRLRLSNGVYLTANDASKVENQLVVLEHVTLSEPVSYTTRQQQPWAYP